jgi:hypothetical protein
MSTLAALLLAIQCGISTSPLGGIIAPPTETCPA